MKRCARASLVLACVAVLPSQVVAQGGTVAVGDAMAVPVTRDYAGANMKELFEAVEASYKKVGIPITERDPIGFSVSNPSFAASKKVFNINLEKIFNCGGDKKAPVAANADLVLNVATVLVKTDEGVRIRSVLTATGTVMSEAGPTAAHCTSLGVLEKRLEPDPARLKCGGAGSTTFVTTVITGKMASSGGPPSSSGSPPTMVGAPSPCVSPR